MCINKVNKTIKRNKIIKTFTEFLAEVKKNKPNNYYEISKTSLEVYVGGKEVHSQAMGYDIEYKYKGKEYNALPKLLNAIAKDNGLEGWRDIKRIDGK